MKDYIRSEYDAEISLRAKKTPMSGALKDNKLDLIIEEGYLTGWRVENKFTSKNSYSIKVDVLEKARLQAKRCGSKCLFRIDFESYEPQIQMSESLFLGILNRLEELEEMVSEEKD